MQDEVTKHGRKIYRAVKDRRHNTGEKIKDILIEVAIIVFAVSLSIWLHGWSEHRHEQKEVREFLSGLKGDLGEDIRLLEENCGVATGLDSSYHFLLSMRDPQRVAVTSDTTIYHNLYFSLTVTRGNIGRYEGFKSSGKMGLIENDSLKQRILTFYQQTIPNLVYGEEFVNSIQSKILDLQVNNEEKVSIKEFIKSPKLGAWFSMGSQNLKNNIGAYNDAIQKAKNIVKEIEKGLK
jgi:hypothetical protein